MVAVLHIRLEGDPVLRVKAKSVPRVTKRVAKLLRDMEDTMYAAEGVGLAAPQIGVSQRLIVVDAGDGPLHLINPQLERGEGVGVDREGCLSLPGVFGYVERYAEVLVSAVDPRGKPVRIEGRDLLARVLQHEMDHLDGVLFTDKATGVTRGQEREDTQNDRDKESSGDEGISGRGE